MDVNAGDWVVFDLRVGQITKIHDGKYQEFSDGCVGISGRISDRCRPLTLRNKSIIESFDHYYKSLDEIDGNAGFNHPDIHQYFCQLALDAIDGEDHKEMFNRARDFVNAARDYKPVIDGVRLFRKVA